MKKVLTLVLITMLLLCAASVAFAATSTETGTGVTVIKADDWASTYADVYASYVKNAENEAIIDHVEEYPMIATVYEGIAFNKYYGSVRGHYYTVQDVTSTGRPHALANCFTCKTPDFTAAVNNEGVSAYTILFEDMLARVNESVSCYNCHANTPGELVVTHTYLADAMGDDFAALNPETASCAQCHVEYYFAPETKAVTLPYSSMETMHPDSILAFFEETNFADYTNPRTGVKQIKVQHPEFETYMGKGSVHAAQFSCADCHMEKATNAAGETYTSHYWVSPLARTVKAARQLLSRAQSAAIDHPLDRSGLEKVCAHLKRSRYRLRESNGRKIYTKNFPGFYGSFLTHLSFLLILLVGALAVITAQVDDRTVMPGQTLTLADGTTITVEFFQIEDTTGTLDYASKLTMRSADGSKESFKEIRVNEPMSFEGYKVYQQTYGTAGSVRIENLANGASEVMYLTESCFLTLNGIDGVFFQALYPGYLKAEDGTVTLITSTSGAYSDPVYDLLSVAEGSMTPVLAFPDETLTIGDVSFTFLKPTSYPGLRIKYMSSALLGSLYAVFALMVAGLYLCFFMVPAAVAVTEEGYIILSPKPQTGLIIGINACLEEEET